MDSCNVQGGPKRQVSFQKTFCFCYVICRALTKQAVASILTHPLVKSLRRPYATWGGWDFISYLLLIPPRLTRRRKEVTLLSFAKHYAGKPSFKFTTCTSKSESILKAFFRVDGDCKYWTYNYKDQKCQTYASLPNFNEEVSLLKSRLTVDNW